MSSVHSYHLFHIFQLVDFICLWWSKINKPVISSKLIISRIDLWNDDGETEASAQVPKHRQRDRHFIDPETEPSEERLLKYFFS